MISIVMMSYLGHYPGARSNPIPKFNRAVQSVVDQTVQDWELIIVSDGCELTNIEYDKYWSNDPRIKLIKTEKSPSAWPGSKRQLGVDAAKGDWIAYLDSDDAYIDHRLQNIHNAIESNPLIDVFFDNVLIYGIDERGFQPTANGKYFETPLGLARRYYNAFLDNMPLFYRESKEGSVGTWCIAHRKDISIKWGDLERRGEDTEFINTLRSNLPYKFVNMSGYVWCHSHYFDI